MDRLRAALFGMPKVMLRRTSGVVGAFAPLWCESEAFVTWCAAQNTTWQSFDANPRLEDGLLADITETSR